MPTTFSPARSRGSTATPPAAPNPTTTTSAGFRLMAMLVSPSRPMIGLDLHAHLLILRSNRRPGPRILDQIPPHEVDVSSVVRIPKHPLKSEPAHAREEWLVLNRSQHLIAFLRRQIGKPGRKRSQPRDNRILLGGQIICQTPVDVLRRTPLKGPGTKLIRRNQSIDKCVQYLAFRSTQSARRSRCSLRRNRRL